MFLRSSATRKTTNGFPADDDFSVTAKKMIDEFDLERFARRLFRNEFPTPGEGGLFLGGLGGGLARLMGFVSQFAFPPFQLESEDILRWPAFFAVDALRCCKFECVTFNL